MHKFVDGVVVGIHTIYAEPFVSICAEDEWDFGEGAGCERLIWSKSFRKAARLLLQYSFAPLSVTLERFFPSFLGAFTCL